MNFKILKHLFFLFIISSSSIYTSCSGPQVCPIPVQTQRLSFAFDIIPSISSSCVSSSNISLNQEFINAVQARQKNAIGGQADKERWLPEFSIASDCENGGWRVDLKSSDVKAITVGNIFGGGRRVILSYDVPISSSGNYAVIPKLLTPCRGTPNSCNVCASKSQKKVFFTNGTIAMQGPQVSEIRVFEVFENPTLNDTDAICKLCN